MFKLKYNKPAGRTSAKERRDLKRWEKKLKAKIINPDFELALKKSYQDLALYGQARVFIGFDEALIIRNVPMEPLNEDV